jgi:hypothetical protein
MEPQRAGLRVASVVPYTRSAARAFLLRGLYGAAVGLPSARKPQFFLSAARLGSAKRTCTRRSILEPDTAPRGVSDSPRCKRIDGRNRMSARNKLLAMAAAVTMWATFQPGTVSAQNSGIGGDGFTRLM